MLQASLFQESADTLTSSQADSLARTLAPLAKAQALKVPAVASIGRYTALQWKYDRLGYFLRMSLLSELEGLTKCSFHWLKQDTPLGLSWWVLGQSGHRTGEIVSGSWHTPTCVAAERTPEGVQKRIQYRKSIGRNSYAIGGGLQEQVSMLSVSMQWPTPHRNCNTGAGHQGRQGGLNLQTAVEAWPTPAAQDSKNATLPPSQISRGTLPGAILRNGPQDLANRSTDGSSQESVPTTRLNPRWVAQLMGLPADWLDGVMPP